MDDDQALYEEVVTLADLWPGAELVLTDGMGHRNLTQDPSIVQRIAEFLL
jgi:pimeloyl-ACP methyl ester carboxylesterase